MLGNSQKRLGRVAARIINKTAAKHKTQISKKLREFVKVNKTTADDSLSISSKAHEPHHLFSKVVVSQTYKIGLNRFKPKQTKKGVTYAISKTGRKLIKGAFIIEKLGGHVFERENPYDPKQTRKFNRALASPKRGTTMYNVYVKHDLDKWSQRETAKEMKFQFDVQLKSALKKLAKQ